MKKPNFFAAFLSNLIWTIIGSKITELFVTKEDSAQQATSSEKYLKKLSDDISELEKKLTPAKVDEINGVKKITKRYRVAVR